MHGESGYGKLYVDGELSATSKNFDQKKTSSRRWEPTLPNGEGFKCMAPCIAATFSNNIIGPFVVCRDLESVVDVCA